MAILQKTRGHFLPIVLGISRSLCVQITVFARACHPLETCENTTRQVEKCLQRRPEAREVYISAEGHGWPVNLRAGTQTGPPQLLRWVQEEILWNRVAAGRLLPVYLAFWRLGA